MVESLQNWGSTKHFKSVGVKVPNTRHERGGVCLVVVVRLHSMIISLCNIQNIQGWSLAQGSQKRIKGKGRLGAITHTSASKTELFQRHMSLECFSKLVKRMLGTIQFDKVDYYNLDMNDIFQEDSQGIDG